MLFMNEDIFKNDEWTQEELLNYQKSLKEEGVEIVLVDTVLRPINSSEVKCERYNPYELLAKYDKEKTVFVLYCDTGKSTKERISYFRSKLDGFKVVSLKGGRGYWRPNFKLLSKEK